MIIKNEAKLRAEWAVSSEQELSQLLFESNEERGRPPVWSHRSLQCRCIGIDPPCVLELLIVKLDYSE